MIIITILVPFILSVIIPLGLPTNPALQVVLYLVAFVALLVSAELSVAFVLKKDKSNAAEFVSEEVNVVSGEVRVLRKEHGDSIGQHADSIERLWQQIADHYEINRAAFEKLGVPLPAQKFSVNARPVGWSVTVSQPTVTTRGGSRWGRFRLWLRRFWSWLKEKVWGNSDHHQVS